MGECCKNTKLILLKKYATIIRSIPLSIPLPFSRVQTNYYGLRHNDYIIIVIAFLTITVSRNILQVIYYIYIYIYIIIPIIADNNTNPQTDKQTHKQTN